MSILPYRMRIQEEINEIETKISYYQKIKDFASARDLQLTKQGLEMALEIMKEKI